MQRTGSYGVKRTSVSEFANIRRNGLRALTLRDGDELNNVLLTDGQQAIFIGTHLGYAVSFKETQVRQMGRTAAGVRGIRLRPHDYVVGSALLKPDQEILVISEKGYGKRTSTAEYPLKGRGGKGIKTVNVTAKNGPLAGLLAVDGSEDIMLITDEGVLIRFAVKDVSQTGRSTLGVRVIKVDDNAKVASLAKVDPQAKAATEDDQSETDDSTTATDQTAADQSATDSKDLPSDVQDLVDRAQADQDEQSSSTQDDNSSSDDEHDQD